MRRQFRHETHNRQERAWKERGTAGARGGSEGKPSRVWENEYRLIEDPKTGGYRIVLATVNHQKIAEGELRAGLFAAFKHHLMSKTFLVSGYRFRFSFDLQAFARANGMDQEKAKATYEATREAAKAKRDMVFRRFCRTPLQYEPNGTPYVAVAWEELLPPA